MQQAYTFSTFNDYTAEGVATTLKNLNPKNKLPVFICIGSDLVLGDSLGPLIGTKLKEDKISTYLYGTLSFPVTAKEVECASNYLKLLHPDSIIISIDAAVGNSDDVGLIKVSNKGVKPGLGVKKNLNVVGDASIIGIVAERSDKNYNLFNMTRLNLVYKMAEQITKGIKLYLEQYFLDNTMENLNIN